MFFSTSSHENLMLLPMDRDIKSLNLCPTQNQNAFRQELLNSFYFAKCLQLANATSAPTFASSTSTAIFPPPETPGETAFDTHFLDGAEIGFAGPTPSKLEVM